MLTETRMIVLPLVLMKWQLLWRKLLLLPKLSVFEGLLGVLQVNGGEPEGRGLTNGDETTIWIWKTMRISMINSLRD